MHGQNHIKFIYVIFNIETYVYVCYEIRSLMETPAMQSNAA